jgi:hypothetical protein
MDNPEKLTTAPGKWNSVTSIRQRWPDVSFIGKN